MRVQRGFSYLLLLWLVAISGVMLTALSHAWQIESRRQREMELVFRGEQIRLAIEAYVQVPVAEGVNPWPTRLEDLLTDTRSGAVVRHLRQVWPDPMSGGHWGLIKEGEGIKGVYSQAPGQPLRAPAGVSRYNGWQFVATKAPAQPASTPKAGGERPDL